MKPKDQDEFTRALFEESGDAMFLLDPESDRLININPVALRLTGFSRSEVLQFPATHLFRVEATGGMQRLRGAFTKTMVFHGQDGFLLRTREDSAWIPVSLTVSRLHVAPRPLGLIVARDDRERRSALAQARRVEAELRTVLANAPSALWSAERSPGPDVLTGWQFRYVSPLLAVIAGRPAEFFDQPMQWADAIYPSDREAYRATVRKLLIGEDADAEQVYRVQVPGGPVRWVRDRLRVVRDKSGRPIRLDGCVTDVTAQREAEDAVIQSERRFRALVEKSQDGILLVDETGAIRYSSPAVKATLGYDSAELIGQNLSDFVHPADRAAMRGRFAYVLTHPGEYVPSRCRLAAADGSIRHLEIVRCNRLDDPSVRAVVVNYRDVTTERETAAVLERHHALLEGLFASVPDVVYYTDRELRFLGGNPAFAELTGRPITDLVGRTCQEVFTGEWAAKLRHVEPDVVQIGRTIQTREWLTYSNGRAVLLDIVISPLRAASGEIIGSIAVGRDVTEREQLEDALRQSAKMEAVGRLAGGIAHDFNNLLTVVLGNLELLQAGLEPVDARESLAAAEAAARQAAELTRQMLGFARRQPLQRTVVDLNDLTRQELVLLRRSIDPRIVVTFTPDPDLPPVVADPVQTQQVLMNLCLNARDAMPEGGTLTITTATAGRRLTTEDTEPTREFVRLSVADSGMGMPEDVRARVFEPFFTTKGVGQGTGLGLAVVYGMVQAHNGWVECHSEPGQGSRFDVYLPCAGEGESPEDLTPSLLIAASGRGETVLVVDDEEGIRTLAAIGLKQHGYRVLEAVDGADAVDVFGRVSGAVNLVVLDATMPNMNGRQAFEAIRVRNSTVPVLFASGHPPGHVLPDPLPPGTAFLSKPYTPAQLAEAVRRALDQNEKG